MMRGGSLQALAKTGSHTQCVRRRAHSRSRRWPLAAALLRRAAHTAPHPSICLPSCWDNHPLCIMEPDARRLLAAGMPRAHHEGRDGAVAAVCRRKPGVLYDALRPSSCPTGPLHSTRARLYDSTYVHPCFKKPDTPFLNHFQICDVSPCAQAPSDEVFVSSRRASGAAAPAQHCQCPLSGRVTGIWTLSVGNVIMACSSGAVCLRPLCCMLAALVLYACIALGSGQLLPAAVVDKHVWYLSACLHQLERGVSCRRV